MCQSYTLSTQTSTPTIASINQLRVFSFLEESANISIAVTLFMIKRDVFFQLFPRCVDLGGTGLTDLLRPSIAIIVCEFAHLSLPASFG